MDLMECMAAQWGKTPLHYAVDEGNEAIVEVLLSKSASVNTIAEVGLHSY